MLNTFTTGLGAGLPPASTLDDRTAQALGLSTSAGFTIPVIGDAAPSSSSMMLWIGLAGLVVAVATYYKKGR